MSRTGCDRRNMGQMMAAAAALLPFAAFGAPLAASRHAPRRAVPEGAFLLERMLTRGLADGATITITRRWRIGFAASADGLEVRGAQVAADVSAPAVLASLAALERDRSDGGVFPILLDGRGLITSSPRGGDGESLLRAIDEGLALLARSRPEVPVAQEEAAFARALAGMGAESISTLPRDLFFPAPARTEATRLVQLPGGGEGSVTVSANATASARTGLLIASERSVLSRLGDSARTATERWSLAAS